MKTEELAGEDLVVLMAGRGPCTYLLLLLIGLILLYPYLEEDIYGRALIGIVFSAVLIVGAYATKPSAWGLALRLGLALFAIGFQCAALWMNSVAYLVIAGLFFAIFLFVAITGVLRYVLRHGAITADKLHGALAGYIMLAFAWAFVYALTERAHPGSFGPAQLDFAQPGTFFKLVYFSLTTLTTTGYGDFIPLTNQARSIVMVQEFMGVFYVGVLIARLAGLYPPTAAK